MREANNISKILDSIKQKDEAGTEQETLGRRGLMGKMKSFTENMLPLPRRYLHGDAEHVVELTGLEFNGQFWAMDINLEIIVYAQYLKPYSWMILSRK